MLLKVEINIVEIQQLKPTSDSANSKRKLVLMYLMSIENECSLLGPVL